MNADLNKKQKASEIPQQNNTNNESNHEEDIDKSENQENKMSKSFETSMTMPVREQLIKMENILDQLQKDLEISKKDMNNLKTDLLALKRTSMEGFTYLSDFILGERNRLAGELKKIQQSDGYETDFLSQQMTQLKLDKEKLDKITEVLSLRISGVETDVGFRFVYDN